MWLGRAIGLCLGLAVALVSLAACRRAENVYWCRRDNRECFADQKDCVHRKLSGEELECFSQAEAYCFLVKSDMFSEASVQKICLPTEEECWQWRGDRRQQRPTLRIGMCNQATSG